MRRRTCATIRGHSASAGTAIGRHTIIDIVQKLAEVLFMGQDLFLD